MAFFSRDGLPASDGNDYEPAITRGWYFEHRADGTWIGPFATKPDATDAEHDHYAQPYAMPMWALYQS